MVEKLIFPLKLCHNSSRTPPVPDKTQRSYQVGDIQYMCIYIYMYLSIYLPTYLPIYLSIDLSIALSIYLPIYLSNLI